MKWIGQHIWDFISRFRSDVYIDDDASLNVKTIKPDDSGDSITMETDYVNITSSTMSLPALIVEGTHTNAGAGPIIILRKNADNVIVGEHLGYLLFQGDRSDGESQAYAGIKATVDKFDIGYELGKINIQVCHEGSLTDAFVASSVNAASVGEADRVNVTIANAVGSTTTVAGDLTVSGGDITLSGTGRIQGIDTVSASTDAANKSYVDGKYMYSYIQIHGRTNNDNTVWNFPDASNDGEFNWEGDSIEAWDGSSSGVVNDGTNTTAGTSTVSLGRETGVMGIVLPYNCTLVGFTGIGRDLSGGNPFKAGLWTSPEFSTYGGNASNVTYTLRAVATASYSGGGGSNYNGICRLEDLSANYGLTAGQILLPSLSESTSSRSYVSMTIVLKVPIIK